MKADLYPNHIYDNCANTSAAATVFQSDGNGASDCTYWRDGDRDGYDTDPSRDISSTGQSCEIDSAFWKGIKDEPLGLHTDKTSGSFTTAGTELDDVYSGSVACELGLRTGDVITDIDGMAVTSLEEVETAIAALGDETSWEVTVTRGSQTLVFNHRIV